jgi:hypothetical protein
VIFSSNLPVFLRFRNLSRKFEHNIAILRQPYRKPNYMKRVIEILVLLASILLGGLLNGKIIEIQSFFIPLPPGADFSTEEGMKNSIHLLSAQHFIFPFLAHALGTLLSGTLAVLFLKKSNKLNYYLWFIGGLFFAAGTYMVTILPAPWWFNILDLTLAYFPMAWLPYYLLRKSSHSN